LEKEDEVASEGRKTMRNGSFILGVLGACVWMMVGVGVKEHK
jgi:hypothetical protein